MELRRKNYLSDFDFILELETANGVVGVPDYDWIVYLYTATNKTAKITISNIDGECRGWFNDNGKIHVVVDNPGNLGTGELIAECYSYLPNDIYPDGSQLIVKATKEIKAIRATKGRKASKAKSAHKVSKVLKETPLPTQTSPRSNLPTW
jgi:hypothetical protein